MAQAAQDSIRYATCMPSKLTVTSWVQPESIAMNWMQKQLWFVLIGFSTFALTVVPTGFGQGHLPDAKRLVFLGDSITHAGGYIELLETACLIQQPDIAIEWINLGLPSETVSGLTEPGHAGGQFPRPDLHERLERVLAQSTPNVVVACYGMNDGIYYPLSEERFQKFREGIERLHDAVVAKGSQIIHLTPAYFDALPIRDRLLPGGLDEYRQPYAEYDDVLEAYSRWLLDRRQDGWIVYDLHQAMKSAVLKRRELDPKFTFASDGVHPNAEGQSTIARPLADAWGLTLGGDGLPDHPHAAKILELVQKKQQILKLAWLTAARHTRPGIPEGLPLNQAQAAAVELDQQARTWVRMP